ncbi:MAG: hypothetical protein AAF456_00645 [Planctomycetota bacterium]
MGNSELSLDEQLQQFRDSRFIAMPIAGVLAWTCIGLLGFFSSIFVSVWSIFIGTGVIFYLGIAVGRLVGEDVLGSKKKGNFFDRVFLLTVVQAIAVYAIAIPFFQLDVFSLPVSVGILTGLMWIPFSALLGHWVGLFHGLSRTALLVLIYYRFPDTSFVTVPAAIVAIYVITIVVLELRYRSIVIARNARALEAA